MGSVIDYFKPIAGKTYCEMLLSFKLHEWSSDGSNWVTPKYYYAHLGGSATEYPSDGRRYLPFWGGGGKRGGCCHYAYGDSGLWERAFKLFYAKGICCQILILTCCLR